MTTLFISDLHLDSERPHITALFEQFLRGEARSARALYILGDLFESWIGDDDDGDTGLQVQRCRVGERLEPFDLQGLEKHRFSVVSARTKRWSR